MSDPSLLNIPYRFKASKLYSQIPEDGLGDFTVTRSASNVATRVNASGFIETVADNVPRLDYPLGGIANGCPALLVEPSAVNYLLRSEEFNNASWGKNSTGINTSIGTNGIEANVAISPDGTQNADRVNFLLQADADLGLNQNYAAATSGQTYNTSIWFKGEGTNIGKQIKVQIKRTSGGTFVGSISTITLTSGWVRFTSPAITLGASNSGVIVTISSNDATNALIWGAQLEQGSVATSYIPTTTAAITRGADVINKTGVSSLIGQTEGTIYAEVDMKPAGVVKAIAGISLNSNTTDFAIIQVTTSNFIQGRIRSGTGTLYDVTASSVVSGITKIAYGYGASGSVLVVNGTVIGTNASGNPSWSNGVNFVHVGNGPSAATGSNQGGFFNDRIRAVALYTTRLTNAELQALTT
jgi:hypothetical protein